jgi:hypothetical protein
MFLLRAEDDPMDTVKNSLVYYAALKKTGVPVEMHLYAHGGRAFGLRRTKLPVTGWPQLVETWLGTIGMIPEWFVFPFAQRQRPWILMFLSGAISKRESYGRMLSLAGLALAGLLFEWWCLNGACSVVGSGWSLR